MNNKLHISERDIQKAVDIIKATDKNELNSFSFSQLESILKASFPDEKVQQIISALSARNIIRISRLFTNAPLTVTVLDTAYVYKLNTNKSSLRFWLPVIISIIALLRPEIVSIIKFILNILST